MKYFSILAIIILSFKVRGHQIRCGGAALEAFKPQFETAKYSSNDKAIVLQHPIDAYYSNRSSANYSRELIKEIIEAAVRSGVDPYLAISIAMVENPPLLPARTSQKDDKKSDNGSGTPDEYYRNAYGAIPLDAIANADVFGCRVENIPNKIIEQGLESAALYARITQDNKALYNKLVDLRKKLPSRPDKKTSDEYIAARNRIIEEMKAKAKSVLASNSDEKLNRIFAAAVACQDRSAEVLDHSCKSVTFQNKKNINFDLRTAGKASKTYDVCQTQAIIPVGGPPPHILTSMRQPIPSEKQACCIKVQADEGLDEEQLLKQIKMHAGMEFIKSKISTGIRSSTSETSSADKISKIIQAYNGYGTIGIATGERVQNNCLSGLNTSENPIYGAGVSDLALNTLMSNSQVRSMVQQAEVITKKKSASLFCSVMGTGEHAIDALTFSSQQKSYLSNRPCTAHSYALNGSAAPYRPSTTAESGARTSAPRGSAVKSDK